MIYAIHWKSYEQTANLLNITIDEVQKLVDCGVLELIVTETGKVRITDLSIIKYKNRIKQQGE